VCRAAFSEGACCMERRAALAASRERLRAPWSEPRCSGRVLSAQASQAAEWFYHVGYTMPYGVNVADFILDLASGDVFSKKRDGEESRKHLIAVSEKFLTGNSVHGYVKGAYILPGATPLPKPLISVADPCALKSLKARSLRCQAPVADALPVPRCFLLPARWRAAACEAVSVRSRDAMRAGKGLCGCARGSLFRPQRGRAAATCRLRHNRASA
jgi:hypothetical protein